ncbi:alcohol dehydrogenase catalytic domain-containing protein [Blautia schinkii]|nr:alcohol dehydrogenase catalytic domain-containing protein [Blautia schinkii]
MKTEAIWVTKPFHVEVQPLEVADEPLADEVQIETKACGICAWDSAMYQGITGPGDPPYAIGHEAVGIVTKVGSLVTDYKVGDKVAVCSATYNVQMAKVVNNKATGVCHLPDDLENWADAVYEPTCCVVNLLGLSEIEPGDRVAVVGCGYMGALTIMGLINGSEAGEIIVFETREDRRELARELGVKKVYGLKPDGEFEGFEELKADGGADVVIDFTTGEAGFAFAQKCLRPQAGKLIVGSWHRQNLTIDATNWHLGGITVKNLSPMSNPHYHDMIPRTATLVEKGVYQPGKLVSHVVNYKDAQLNHIFEISISKEENYMKGVVTFDD